MSSIEMRINFQHIDPEGYCVFHEEISENFSSGIARWWLANMLVAYVIYAGGRVGDASQYHRLVTRVHQLLRVRGVVIDGN